MKEFTQIQVRQQTLNHFTAHFGMKTAVDESGIEGLILLFVEDVVLLDRIFTLVVVAGIAGIFDDIGFVIEDALQIFHLHAQQRTDPAGQGVDVPDVCHRRHEVDVAHAVAAYFGGGDFDPALFADDAFVAHLLVFTAKTLVVTDRPEDFGAEKSVAFGLEGAVVDRLGFFDFTEAPGENLLRTRQPQLDRLDILGTMFFGYFNGYQFLHSLLPHLKALHRVRVTAVPWPERTGFRECPPAGRFRRGSGLCRREHDRRHRRI